MKTKQILISVAIVLLSALAAAALVRSRPEVETQKVEPIAPLVRVLTAERTDVPLDVKAQGTVLPRTEAELVAQVAGEVVATSPDFVAGGFFARGEMLLRLDARDYELAVERANAQIAQAEVQLALEEAEANVAREEWAELGEGEPGPLVLREPQTAQARANLAAARAALQKAQLDLDRTKIRAPFAGRVRAKRVDLGQYVAPGTPLASIHAIDFAEVRLPVADDQLAYLDLPLAYRDARDAEGGPDVVLEARFGRERHAWQGRIVRTEGELDPRTRMLNLVARVEDPYGRSGEDPDRPPLAVGLFVEATIDGRLAEDVFVLPRAALRPGAGGPDQVLVVDDGRLRFRDVSVLRLTEQRAILDAGLEPGEQVVVSPLDVVSDGMRVRTVDAAADARAGMAREMGS